MFKTQKDDGGRQMETEKINTCIQNTKMQQQSEL